MYLTNVIWLFISWTFSIALTEADVICETRFGYPVKYCYGITAFCCGDQLEQCCWEKIWKVWWFWVVAFVIITAIFSCCGYYCSSTAESGRYGLLRSDSFNVFHRFRRFSSYDYSTGEEHWKPPEVELPPYTPIPSTSSGVGTSIDPNPQQNMPYLEPPPPYTTVASHPQPLSDENTPLVTSEIHQSRTDNQSHGGATTTTVSSH